MIVELKQADDPRVSAMLALARAEFPPELLESDAQLRAELTGDGPVRYFVWDEQGVRGFIRAAWFSAGVLVVHLGVDPSFRMRGIGRKLLEHVQTLAEGRPVFAEVDEGPAMRWWQTQGARVIDPAYVQPSLSPGTPPVPLNLMALGEVVDAPGAVHAILSEFYGQEANPS